jgi:hypothetical protein
LSKQSAKNVCVHFKTKLAYVLRLLSQPLEPPKRRLRDSWLMTNSVIAPEHRVRRHHPQVHTIPFCTES